MSLSFKKIYWSPQLILFYWLIRFFSIVFFFLFFSYFNSFFFLFFFFFFCLYFTNIGTMTGLFQRSTWSRASNPKLSYLSSLMTKPTKWHVRPAKPQISLGIRPVWSDSLLCAWRNLGSLATYWAHSEDPDQTGRMPRLIWVFAGCTAILLVLSWGSSF